MGVAQSKQRLAAICLQAMHSQLCTYSLSPFYFWDMGLFGEHPCFVVSVQGCLTSTCLYSLETREMFFCHDVRNALACSLVIVCCSHLLQHQFFLGDVEPICMTCRFQRPFGMAVAFVGLKVAV